MIGVMENWVYPCNDDAEVGIQGMETLRAHRMDGVCGECALCANRKPKGNRLSDVILDHVPDGRGQLDKYTAKK